MGFNFSFLHVGSGNDAAGLLVLLLLLVWEMLHDVNVCLFVATIRA